MNRQYLTRPATPQAIRIEGGRYSFVFSSEETESILPIKARDGKPSQRDQARNTRRQNLKGDKAMYGLLAGKLIV